jgi:Zn-dependent protease/CBS domain-containing protein
MRWSWKIATVAGIGIYVHWTFVLIVAWVAYIYAAQAGRLLAAVDGIIFLLALFACIVAHELGHALTARRFGIRTRDITLLPIGGVARLERMPEEPLKEFLVAVGGPIVTAVLALVFAAMAVAMWGPQSLLELDAMRSPLVVRLAWVNAFLLGFNLLLAFPMDGGRMLRALLHTAMDYAKATRIAALIGQGMAVLFGIVGFFINPFLIIIAFFVFLGAQAEVQAAQVKSLTSGVPVRAAMVTNFRTLSPHATLHEAVQMLLSGEQQDFLVVENGQVRGVLTRAALLRAVAENGDVTKRVGELMSTECKPVQENEMLERAFERMRENGCPVLPVLRRGELVGMLTLENVGEWMMIQNAVRRSHARSSDEPKPQQP